MQLVRYLDVNRNTAYFIQRRLRLAMNESDQILSGIIKVDESYIEGTLENKYPYKKKNRPYYKTRMEHKNPIIE